MRGIPAAAGGDRSRTRRWDAVVLGGALPGLISAIRLGMSGARVLILEERAAVESFPGLREPFLVSGASSRGVLGSCLQDLGIPLIERQRIGSDSIAYQVVFPDARLDIGERHRTSEELAQWSFASAAEADSLLRDLADASAAERDAMLEAPVVRGPRRRPRGPAHPPAPPGAAGQPSRHARGLPAEITAAKPPLSALWAAQVRALSNLGRTSPSPEALARLLGLSLESGVGFAGGDVSLRGLLRRRLESLHGEFRILPPDFALVTVSGHPGVLLGDSGDVWCGRLLLVNAPRAALAEALGAEAAPEILAAEPPSHRRLAVHLRTRRELLPSGMCQRVIAVRDPAAPLEGTNVVSLRIFPDARRNDGVDLVASAVIDAADPDPDGRAAEIEATVGELMPFAAEDFERPQRPAPRWDRDDWLGDPPPHGSWPAACEVRLSSKPPTFALDRAGVAGLGFEGDVLLGWRAGDVMAAELS